ncbi:Protein arginine N-methyltransferase 5 [Rhizopus stolonifer]|uniref:Protein arginine N-methyltransferase n=1 Tax=Rhizopus stolonifer TaxID=4846 RepID=A0A367KPN1_RHIST|nr:Protein arginine N-methyltransferase 5 [Rhizopus stolonifer]
MSRQCSIGLLATDHVTLRDAENWGYDFITAPITRPSFENTLTEMGSEEYKIWKDCPLFDSKDINPTLTACARKVVAFYPNWLELDSSVNDIRIRSELAFKQQVEYITHCGVRGGIFPKLCQQVENTARCLNSVLTPHSPQICVRVRLGEKAYHWKRWNKLRTMTEYNPRLGVALEITPHLPKDTLHLWLSEPVRILILSLDLFINNKHGYPVMTKDHQQFVKTMMHVLSPDIILAGTLPERAADCCQYIKFLNRKLPELTKFEESAWGFHDVLQVPLQPLAHHLENQFYETFEKDPIKYEQYEKAIFQALVDRIEDLSDEITTIGVVGAGRGPLVNCCLRASERSQRKIHVYAIEKNPHAYVTLQNMKATVWGDNVSLVFSDMRTWKPDIKYDILVSELLGSFGDNELSPECLDGAQRFLKESGISIPSSYTTSIAPLSSNRIYTNIMARKEPMRFETPYVVMFHQTCLLDSPQDLWTFHHPNKKDIPFGLDPINNLHNTQYQKTQFSIRHDCLMHGIAGYFDCTLYNDVTISIHPDTHSPGMFSWFPIFFPLQNPIHLTPESIVTVCFWRLTDQKKVWYEWSVSVNDKDKETHVSMVHNAKGKSYSMSFVV